MRVAMLELANGDTLSSWEGGVYWIEIHPNLLAEVSWGQDEMGLPKRQGIRDWKSYRTWHEPTKAAVVQPQREPERKGKR